MVLVSLPDIKILQKFFTLGKNYAIISVIGNGYSLYSDSIDKDGNSDMKVIVLAERFEEYYV